MKKVPLFLTILLTILLGLSTSLKADTVLSFVDYWKEVQESNPTIQEQIAIIKSNERLPSLEIPSPEVSISQMNAEVPFSSRAKMKRTLELSQKIPFPSKFSNAKDVKNTNIKKSYEAESLWEKTLKEEAYQAFLTYEKNQEIKNIFNEKIKFYQDHLIHSKALQVTNQTYQTYLIDIELEISTLQSEIKLIDIAISENKFLLNQIRNHDTNDPLDALKLPELTSPQSYVEEGLKDHPKQKQNQYEIANMNSKLEMAKLDWAPDFNLKLRSIKSYSRLISDGKEIMIGMTLPFVFPWQRNDKVESLSYKLKAQEFKGQEIHNQLNQEYLTLKNKIAERWALLVIYKDKTLPLIKTKLKLARKLTILDMQSLNVHKDAIDQYTNLKLKIIEEETNYRMSNFKLQELIGSKEGKM
jgi:cobalt-zinc-cadmium efflux system outer membrane protein